MSTYSNGAGYPISADKLQDLNSVLHELPDNTNHYISPKFVRDAVYTTWENVIFKPTTIPSSEVEYIGIDQTSFTEKILLGRKQVSTGQYVLSDYLLNSDGDIFLYNTTTGTDTTLVFLAGTGSNFYNGDIFAPKITSKVVNTISDGQYLDLNISNNTWVNYTTPYGGNINIGSEYGFVNINNINIPTKIQNSVASVGNVLSISSISSGNIYLQWSTVTGSSTGGGTAYYSNSTPVPQTIGGILAGSTFSNVSVQDMLTRLLYPYIPPTLSLSLSTYFVEIGAAPSNLILNYTIGRNATYSLDTLVTYGGILGLPSYPSLPSISYLSSVTSTSSVSFPNNAGVFSGAYGSNTFTMSVHDTNGVYVTSSTTVNVVLPWYWGTSNIGSTTSTLSTILSRTSSISYVDLLTPLLTSPATQSTKDNNKSLPFTGQNKYIYFGYPSSFPYLEQILDGSGFDITGSFKTYSVSLISPNPGYWSRSYTFYIYTGPIGSTITTTTLGSPFTGYSENFSFLFATAS